MTWPDAAGILPVDADAATLVGRAWTTEGPCVVAVRRDGVVDLSRSFPTMRALTEHDDPVDGVGPAHQRRVQRVRHLRDDLEADERGEHEDRELGQQVH